MNVPSLSELADWWHQSWFVRTNLVLAAMGIVFFLFGR